MGVPPSPILPTFREKSRENGKERARGRQRPQRPWRLRAIVGVRARCSGADSPRTCLCCARTCLCASVFVIVRALARGHHTQSQFPREGQGAELGFCDSGVTRFVIVHDAKKPIVHNHKTVLRGTPVSWGFAFAGSKIRGLCTADRRRHAASAPAETRGASLPAHGSHAPAPVASCCPPLVAARLGVGNAQQNSRADNGGHLPEHRDGGSRATTATTARWQK